MLGLAQNKKKTIIMIIYKSRKTDSSFMTDRQLLERTNKMTSLKYKITDSSEQ